MRGQEVGKNDGLEGSEGYSGFTDSYKNDGGSNGDGDKREQRNLHESLQKWFV